MTALKKIVIIGGGGHARVLRDCLSMDDGFTLLGYTDMKPCPLMDIDYLGSDEMILENYQPADIYLVNGIGSVRLPQLRREVYQKFKAKGYLFACVVHPRSFISARAHIAEGVQILAGAIINTGAKIAENVIINTSSSVDHDCVIESHTHIAPGVTLSGDVRIGSGCHVGTGAKIIQGIGIGQGVLIGAGAIVINDVEDGQIRVGVV